ncbi:MAG TPA: ribokinase [Actinocrinis sp.]|uniref:ribokinase n=1 Tax=Actinocrinis sp. TaxID=1920516 RepID=UPI002DDDAB4B|nr:ribokinase [Actinocrinis sp.]HEV2348069.1 ribokinase [Actinocrinis sp.]
MAEPARRAGRVTVFGSVNLDLLVRGGDMPGAGETVLMRSAKWALGGKGANQAVAAVRAGAEALFVGAVGAGADGERLVRALRCAGVDVAHVRTVQDVASGLALVFVSDDGESRIVVVPGANHMVSAADAEAAGEWIAASDVLVVQGELPAPATGAAVRLASEAGVRVVVNLAPRIELGAQLGFADPLVVNEVEAGQLLGESLESLSSVSAVLAAGSRFRALARSVVVTVGAAGAVLITGEGTLHVPALPVDEVCDTTGAGDALVGVLAAQLAAGSPLADALRLAVAAASLSVTVVGAAESYPEFGRELSRGSRPGE